MEDNLSQNDIDELLAKMKYEVKRQKKAHHLVISLIGLLLGLQILLMVLSRMYHWGMKVFPFLNFIGIIPAAVYGRMNTEKRKKTIEEITKREVVRFVGPLCDVLSFRDAGMVTMAEEALVKLLPRLKASDSGLLNMEQRKLLYGTLKGQNKPLVLSLLKALEQIGDEKALPYVKELCAGNYLAANPGLVRNAARECLPALRQRIETLKVGQDLLRASGPDVQPETLLRPAMATPETEPQQLLRASRTDTSG